MRLIGPLFASLSVHAAVLGLPSGSLSPGDAAARNAGLDASGTGAPPLLVRLHPAPSAASIAAREAAAVANAREARPPIGSGPTPPASFGLPLHYYTPHEVTRRPEPIGDIPPSLPPQVENDPGSGRLVLVLRIAESGRVDAVEVEDSSLEPPTASALAAQFLVLRFRPAEINGAAVKSRMKIEVTLRPPEG